MSLLQLHSNSPIEPQRQIEIWQQRIEQVLADLIPSEDCGAPGLHQAMRYAALGGGKRIRPVLVYAAGQALNLDEDMLDSTAAAIEIIHAYSLIHDDLPAMDDDDMRRGRASVHIEFDEATAMLAGDALQALAFEVLSADPEVDAQVCLRMVTALAQACGSMGMAGGQALDLGAVGKVVTPEQLEAMHRLKTGKLIQLCLIAPAMVAQASPSQQQALSNYGDCIGLAFQIHDDILDVIGESETLGKPVNADSRKSKPTFPAVHGLDQSRHRAAQLRDKAIESLAVCPGSCGILEYLADYVVSRDR